MHGLTCLLSLLPTNPTSPHFTRPTYFRRPATCLPACLPACLSAARPPARPPACLPVCCPTACLPAGRRGKDDKGMVFLMVDDALDITTAK